MIAEFSAKGQSRAPLFQRTGATMATGYHVMLDIEELVTVQWGHLELTR